MSNLPLFVGADIRALDGAACYNPDGDVTRPGPDAWYPDGIIDWKHGLAPTAVATCRRCPVRVNCLTQALDRDEQVGIWAGYDFGNHDDKNLARKALKVKRRRAA